VAEAGVTAAGAGSAFRIYAEASGDFHAAAPGAIQTGLAISNASATTAIVTVELTDLNGAASGPTGSFAVPGNGQVSTFINQIPGLASLPLPFRGVLRITSTQQVSVVGLKGRYNERNDFLIAATPPVNESTAATSAELFFPHFVEAGGYTTQFILFSGAAGQESSGTLRLFSRSGEPVRLLQ
jgi:hypothetical protein